MECVKTVPLTADTCIASEFGPRRRGFHSGTDLRTKHRTTSSVFAVADGTVVNSSNDTGHSGEYVKIWHEAAGIYSVYAHLSSRYVSPDDTVKKGEVIGVAGETGRAFGEHLHFGVKDSSDEFMNPEVWFRENGFHVEKCSSF